VSRFPAIPEPSDLPSTIMAVRAMKDIVEQLAGQRQGNSLGAPQVFLQSTAPQPGARVVLGRGDIWFSDPGMSYWDGQRWVQLIP
jgi:hypothetical protein